MNTYICLYCRQPSDPGSPTCPLCGAPGDTRSVVSDSGWVEQPPIRDMARLQLGQSHCQIAGSTVPAAEFTLAPEIQVADRTIHDAEDRDTVTYSVDQILSHSSNVGAITLAEMLGKERLSQWISRFGFGHTTGIDYPGETDGIVLPLERWSGTTIGTVPFGQGIAVTPIQMAAMFATLANDGVWVQPHIVKRVGTTKVSAADVERHFAPLADELELP